MSLLARARHEYLLRQLELYGSVRASSVASELDVTQVTIRRDIERLHDQGLLQRVHGGAVAVRSGSGSEKVRAARSLIGVVVPSSTFYYPDVIAGMESVAASLNIRIVLGISSYDQNVERTQVERLLALGVKGLVLTPTFRNAEDLEDLTPWLESIPVPVVMMERLAQTSLAVRELDTVRTDHRHGAWLAVDHFARLGHRRVVLAINDNTPTAPSIRAGYRDAVEQLGLEEVEVLPMPDDIHTPDVLAEAVEDLLDRRGELGTAFLAHSDPQATLIVEAAQLRGLRVPQDLAIIAYDDMTAAHAAVPMSAITPPRHELGREALRLIRRRLGERADPDPPRHEQLLPKLTVRESCGATGLS